MFSVLAHYATMPASRVGPLGKDGCRGERGSARSEHSRLNVLIALTAAIIGLIYGRPRLHRQRPIVPGACLRPLYFHDLRRDLGSGARAVVRGTLRRKHLEHHRPQALSRHRRARIRGVRRPAGACPQRVVSDGRQVFLGLAIGTSIVVAPAYLAESAPVSVRDLSRTYNSVLRPGTVPRLALGRPG